MGNAEKIKAIKKQSAEIIKSYKKMAKLSAVDFQDVTQKRWENVQADMSWLGMEISKQEHELHCLCVEAFICERSEWRYGEKEFQPSPFHRYKIKMREPKK